MTAERHIDLTAAEVLRRYREEILLEFLDIPLHDVNQRGNFGDCPLHIAASRGYVEELRALISGGADLNLPGDQGYTPLHNAVLMGHVDAVKFLLDSGADRTIKSKDGRTARDMVESLEGAEAQTMMRLFSRK